ncbi:MAG TPA: DUF3619 family protein [Ramlibacter sp.]|nr:DUF3619 family protein [Ramlibacter sp.]
MTNKPLIEPEYRTDWFGRQVAARLSAGTAELPYDVSERLRAARVQAVARRKQAHRVGAASVFAFGGAATLGFDEEGVSLWNRIASVLPLVALAAGLILINAVQNDWRASEVAEVDAALLTDDLPPAAYADSGFLQFLKSGGE